VFEKKIILDFLDHPEAETIERGYPTRFTIFYRTRRVYHVRRMASRGINEPNDEFLKIYDTLTGGWIFICNRSHGIDHNWRRNYLDKNADGKYTTCPTIDVTRQAPYNDGNNDSNKRFTFDSFVDTKNVDKFCKLLIDYSCWMNQLLLVHKKVVIFCKNGRSRSPNVVLAFLLLRGMTRDAAVGWLTLANKTQRPHISRTSAAFPNFVKFFNVTLKLHNELKEWRLNPAIINEVGERIKYNHQKLLDLDLSRSTDIEFMFNANVNEPAPQALIDAHLDETTFYHRNPENVSRSSSSSTTKRSKRISSKSQNKTSDSFEVGSRVKSFIKTTDGKSASVKAYVSSKISFFVFFVLGNNY